MAYAYPSDHPSSSQTNLNHHPSHSHSHSHPNQRDRTTSFTGSHMSSSRKNSDPAGDVLREFRVKIDEDSSYVSFFEERIRVEEQYIAGLQRLYDRTNAVDSLHDDQSRRANKPTSRRAWQEVRDYTQREIQSREAMVAALKEDVVRELVKLKEEQTRIRHNLKETIKLSNEMYEKHAKEKLPKLKQTYFQKCQAVEDIKRQENAIAAQARLLSSPSPTSPSNAPAQLQDHPNTYTSQHFSPPMSTPPLPPMSNPAVSDPAGSSLTGDNNGSPSKSGGGRHRAGSAADRDKAKDMLGDLALQSKKGFNAIMQKLGGDKGERSNMSGAGSGGMGGAGGGGPEKEEGGFVMVPAGGEVKRSGTLRRDEGKVGGAMKGVRAKREADDADKAYRDGVFHLESLRLRREKLQSSAITSLETFHDELIIKLRMALERYIDAVHGTAATNAQATEVARQAVEAVNLESDMMLFRSKLRAIEPAKTMPVPYQNFYVGECRSLIFGVSLTDYDFARGEGGDHGRPPTIVEKCIAAIDEKGLEAEGIYRISGRQAGVQKMIQEIERDEEKFQFDERDDVFSISNVLKQYLRELREPVFHIQHTERVKYTENRESHIHSNFSALRGRLRRLPPIHQTTFRAIIEHLGRVNARSAVNKMDAKNLAVVFNSVIFGHDQLPTDVSALTLAKQDKDTLLEDIITYSDLLFGDEPPNQAPTLLPPGSGLSRSGVISYHPVDDGPQPGSSHTRVKITDGTGLTRVISPGTATSSPKSPNKGSPKAEEEEAAKPAFALTPDEELDLLFDPALIPFSMHEAVGSDLHVRPLSSTDLMRSHFGLLATLTVAPPIAPSLYSALFAHLKSCPDTYYIIVIVDKTTDQLVAHGAAILERKYIHGGSVAAHVEDIVVSPEMRGRGLGLVLVNGVRELALSRGCYKVNLHCKPEKVPFYEKCGFGARGAAMVYTRPSDADATPSLASAPTVPPPQSPTVYGGSSSLGAPELRVVNRTPTPELASSSHEGEGEGEGEGGSVSSGSVGGVTYQFPTVPAASSSSHVSPPPPTTQPASSQQGHENGAHGQGEEVFAQWANEGLGSADLKPKVGSAASSPTHSDGVAGGGGGGGEGRATTPLPPGAAPPDLEAEPDRKVETERVG